MDSEGSDEPAPPAQSRGMSRGGQNAGPDRTGATEVQRVPTEEQGQQGVIGT